MRNIFWFAVLVTESFKSIPTKWFLVTADRPKFDGVLLKFTTSHSPPFEVNTLNPDGTYTVGGIGPLFYSWLARRLNFTMSYVVLNSTAITKFGSEIGLALHLVSNKEVDGISSALIATPERMKSMDFASYIWIEPFTMVVPRPGEEPRLLAFIRPFQTSVWLLIMIVCIVLVMSISVFSIVYRKNIRMLGNRKVLNDKRYIRSGLQYVSAFSIYLIKTITYQGGNDPINFPSVRIVIGFWLAIATVLVNSYSSTVTSYLTVPKMKPSINTLEDLAASQDVGIILWEDIIVGKVILEAQSGVLKTLGDQARQNPGRLFKDFTNITETLETGRFAFPYANSFGKFFVGEQFKINGKCNFQMSNPLPFTPPTYCVTLQKNSKYTSAFTTALLELSESGLPNVWMNSQTSSKASQCFAKSKSGRTALNQVSIKLVDITGAFLILGTGLVLGVVVFIFECLFKKKNIRL